MEVYLVPGGSSVLETRADLDAFCNRTFLRSLANRRPPYLVATWCRNGVGVRSVGNSIDRDVDVLTVNDERDLQRLLQ